MAFNIHEAQEVRTVLSSQEATRLIKDGWKLLAVAPGKDEMGYPITAHTLGLFPDELEQAGKP